MPGQERLEITGITRESLQEYRGLILPYIFRELSDFPEDLDTEYICLAAVYGGKPVSVIVSRMEEIGDVSILSIYTLPQYRRKGAASALAEKTVQVARALFTWEEDETVETVVFKTIYRLPEDLEEGYRAFLEANHFTEFVLLEEAGAREALGEPDAEEIGSLNVWCGFMEVRFWKTAAEEQGAEQYV